MKSRVERFGIWFGVGERVGAGNTASSESLCVVYEVSGSFLSSSAKVLLPSSRSLKKVSHHFPVPVLSPQGGVPSLPGPCPVPLRGVSCHFPAPVCLKAPVLDSTGGLQAELELDMFPGRSGTLSEGFRWALGVAGSVLF